MSILTAKEVIQNSPEVKELTSRPDPVCDVLDHSEYDFMVNVFGETVYQEFLDALTPVSAATVWNDETDYVLNNIVIYEGIYYKLNVANSSSSDTPNCNSEWTIVDKFTKECFNSMWNYGLKKLLSWVVFAKAAPFYPNIMGVVGFTGTDKEYQQHINYKLNFYYKNITIMQKRLLKWNESNKCVTINLCSELGENSSTTNQTPREIAW